MFGEEKSRCSENGPKNLQIKFKKFFEKRPLLFSSCLNLWLMEYCELILMLFVFELNKIG